MGERFQAGAVLTPFAHGQTLDNQGASIPGQLTGSVVGLHTLAGGPPRLEALYIGRRLSSKFHFAVS